MKDLAEQSRQQRLKELFEAALELAPDARAPFLQSNCSDPALRAAVQELLAAHAQADGFLETSPFAVALSQPVETATGQRLGPYRLLREIGRGGMATVYLAVRDDDEYQQEVAIKLIWPSADSAEVVRRFRQERQILANLNHPNIARLLDGGTTEQGWPYLVMEYVAGVPITHYCNAQRLSVNERLKLFQTVCAAVAHAHRNLVVHRDLKPSNILVTDDGTVKLLDFGIAKMLAPEATSEARTRTGRQLMTPEYASPEQVREETITTASDVYSLGVLLYELLAGQRPHELQDRPLHEIIRVLDEEDAPPPSRRVTPAAAANFTEASAEKLQRHLRGDLDNIVLLALSKQAPPRYRTVEELREDLRRQLAGEPVQARPATLAYRLSKYVKRHKGRTVFLLSLCTALIFALWQWQATRTRERAQRRELYAARVRQASVDWFDGNLRGYYDALQSPPVQPRPGEEDLRGLEWRYLWRLGHRERVTLAPADEWCCPGLVEEGLGDLTYSDAQRRFTRWDARTHERVAEWQLPAAFKRMGVFKLAGRTKLVAYADSHTLVAIDLLDGTQPQLLHEPGSAITGLTELDEQQFLTGHTDGQIKLWDARTGQPRATLFTGADSLRHFYFNPSRDRLVTLSWTNKLRLWTWPQPRLLLQLADIPNLASGANAENWLVVPFKNNSLAVYDMRTARQLSSLPITGSPAIFAVSANSKHLVISFQNNTVKLYELPELRLVGTFSGHAEWVNAVRLLAGGRLATGSSDRTIKLWDIATQRELATLKGHLDDVIGVNSAAQDSLLITTSQDKTVKLWDLAEVLGPATLTGHTGRVFSVAFAPDGRTLASASEDRTIKLWDVTICKTHQDVGS